MSRTPQSISFLVIGAQKAGTTALYHYLTAHPQIYTPRVQEVGFFAHDKHYTRGIEAYYESYFGNVPTGAVCGETSPQYMCFQRSAARIASHLPKVRIIAALRNPIDRAYSHYRMTVRRRLETRSFEESVAFLMRRGFPPDSEVDPHRDYVAFGEYGRILREYMKYFPRDHMHVVWSDDLESDTRTAMRGIYSFLGVDATFNSRLFSQRFHRGGAQRFPKWFDTLVNVAFRRPIPLVGLQRYQAFKYWYKTEANIRPDQTPGISTTARNTLRAHYALDLQLLQTEFGVTVPWPEYRLPTTDAQQSAG